MSLVLVDLLLRILNKVVKRSKCILKLVRLIDLFDHSLFYVIVFLRNLINLFLDRKLVVLSVLSLLVLVLVLIHVKLGNESVIFRLSSLRIDGLVDSLILIILLIGLEILSKVVHLFQLILTGLLDILNCVLIILIFQSLHLIFELLQ